MNANKYILPAVLCLWCSLVASGASALGRHEMNIGDFESLEVIDNVNVDYYCNADSAGKFVLYCTAEQANGFILSNNGKGKFTIQLTAEQEDRPDIPRAVVYSSALREAMNSSDSTLRLHGIPEQARLRMRTAANGRIEAHGIVVDELSLGIATGKGTIVASGRCRQLAVSILGTGVIDAEQVIAHDVRCKLTGTGTARCHVDGGELRVKGIGTGKVLYRGTPSQVKVKKMGSVKAVPIE